MGDSEWGGELSVPTREGEGGDGDSGAAGGLKPGVEGVEIVSWSGGGGRPQGFYLCSL